MRVRKLDANGDMTFGNGQQNFWINLPQTVAQVIMTVLKLIRGEWYLDNTQGTPWFDGVLGVYSQASADATLRTQIQLVQGVSDIENFLSSTDPATRKYSLDDCLVNTIYGPTNIALANYRNY